MRLWSPQHQDCAGLALPASSPTDRVVAAIPTKTVAVQDYKTANLPLQVADAPALKAIVVSVDIEHTYISDLVVATQLPKALSLPDIATAHRQLELDGARSCTAGLWPHPPVVAAKAPLAHSIRSAVPCNR